MKPMKPKRGINMMLYVALLLLVVMLMVSLRTCSVRDPFGDIRRMPSQGDTLDVAIEYSPLSLYRYADTLGGFNYDALRSMVRQNGMALKFHPMVSLTQGMDGLESGLYDIIVADMPVTVDLQERFEYTEPIYLDRQVLVQRRDSTGALAINSQLDLAGKEVWVPANSPIEGRIRNLSSEIGDTIIVSSDEEYGPEQLFLLTAAGEIDLSVVNERVARIMAKDYENIDISTDVSFTQFQAWLMRKEEPALADSLNAMIRRFKVSPEYDALIKRYFK